MLFGVFSPQNAKKHSKSTLWGTPRQVPKIAQKALRGALSDPGPKSTPVNGGPDRKACRVLHAMQPTVQGSLNLSELLVICYLLQGHLQSRHKLVLHFAEGCACTAPHCCLSLHAQQAFGGTKKKKIQPEP